MESANNLTNTALLHLLFEDFVNKDPKKLQDIIDTYKPHINQKNDDLCRLNYVVSNYAIHRNVNYFFTKLDKKLNRLDELLLEEVNFTSGENHYPLMYNYACVSKAANRLHTIFNIKNKGFNATDDWDYEYSKIKLAIMLFEISFYYQNFEGTSI